MRQQIIHPGKYSFLGFGPFGVGHVEIRFMQGISMVNENFVLAAERLRDEGATAQKQGDWTAAYLAYRSAFDLEVKLERHDWAAFCAHMVGSCLYEAARLQSAGKLPIELTYHRERGSREFKVTMPESPSEVASIFEISARAFRQALVHRQKQQAVTSDDVGSSLATHRWMLALSYMCIKRVVTAWNEFKEAESLYRLVGNTEMAKKASYEWILINEIMDSIHEDDDLNTSVEGTVSFDWTIEPAVW